MMDSAADLKNRGNTFFSSKNYSEAINCYSKAIIRNPDIATYYTNRALCYIRLKQWDLACQDCQKCLEINPSLIKAHFFKGQALLESNYLDESISSLTRAFNLAKEQKQCFGDDIAKYLRLARKRKWMQEEEKRVQQEIELQTELNALLIAEKKKQLEKSQKMEIDNETESNRIEESFDNQLLQLNQLFETCDDKRKKREVPEALCCRINFGIMSDPVITPSGITYDRQDIEEHIKCLGPFDPVSRKELKSEHLIPNLALKEIIDNFLEENPWAIDY